MRIGLTEGGGRQPSGQSRTATGPRLSLERENVGAVGSLAEEVVGETEVSIVLSTRLRSDLVEGGLPWDWDFTDEVSWEFEELTSRAVVFRRAMWWFGDRCEAAKNNNWLVQCRSG